MRPVLAEGFRVLTAHPAAQTRRGPGEATAQNQSRRTDGASARACETQARSSARLPLPPPGPEGKNASNAAPVRQARRHRSSSRDACVFKCLVSLH